MSFSDQLPYPPKKIFIVAGEASGDIYGGLVATYLDKLSDGKSIMKGWGGESMSKAGVEVTQHYRDLAFMGIWEVVRNLRTVVGNLKRCWAEIEAYQPDILLLVDFPGFNMRIARKAKLAGIPVFQLVAPQVWAWKSGRIKDLARDYDAVFPVLPFEHDLLINGGVNSVYLGHPLLDVLKLNQNPHPELSALQNLGKPILALLPGSRAQELKKMLPILLETASRFPQFQPIIAGAPGTPDNAYLLAKKSATPVIFGATRSILASAHYAIITSGTATLEAALLDTPHIVAYKTSGLTYLAAKLLLKVPYISLPNIILNKALVSECIQDNCNPNSLEIELHKLCQKNIKSQKTGFEDIRNQLGQSGATRKIAVYLLSRT